MFVVIGAFLVVMYAQIPAIEDVELETASFYDEVVFQTDKKIPQVTSVPNFNAVSSYNRIVNEIITERLLNKISSAQEDSCMRVVNAAVISNINSVSKMIINGGNWNRSQMDVLRTKNQWALTLTGCSKSDQSALRLNIKTVNTYDTALNVYYKSKSYTSVSDSKYLISKAQRLKTSALLRSCKLIIDDLSNVPRNLYAAHLSVVKTKVPKTNDAKEAKKICDLFVSCASMYGYSESDAKNAIKAELETIEAKHRLQTREKSKKIIIDVNEDDW